jgi:hypothetical protein
VQRVLLYVQTQRHGHLSAKQSHWQIENCGIGHKTISVRIGLHSDGWRNAPGQQVTDLSANGIHFLHAIVLQHAGNFNIQIITTLPAFKKSERMTVRFLPALCSAKKCRAMFSELRSAL